MDSTTPLITDANLREICTELEDYVGLGLNFTKYGQQALLLSGGMLATKRVSLSWLGGIPT